MSPRGRLVLPAAAVLAACAPALSVREGVLDQAKLGAMECISVLPFENYSRDPHAGGLVAQELASRLLTSEHYNVLAPAEAQAVLRAFDVPLSGTNDARLGRKYGEVLGVHGVLIGAVTEYGRRDLTQRTRVEEPVVGFTARLVDTRTGAVVWTSTASHYDYQVAFAIPRSQQSVLGEAVQRTVGELVAARSDLLPRRGLCAAAYVSLEKGERPAIASIAEITRIVSSARYGGPSAQLASLAVQPARPAAGTLVQPPAGSGRSGATPALPAVPGGDGGLGVPALPDLPPEGGGALPALPSLSGAGDMPALPDLPPNGGAGGLAPGAGAPDLPPLDPAPADLVAEPTAVPAGPPPASLLARLSKTQRTLAGKLFYPDVRVVLATDFPRKAGKKLTLPPRTRRSLNDLAAVLKAARDMRVRLEVYTDLTGTDTGDAAMKSVAARQGELMQQFLASAGVGRDQVTVLAFGRVKRVKKKGAPADNHVDVAVLRYPSAGTPVAADSTEPPLPELPPEGDVTAGGAPLSAAPPAARPGFGASVTASTVPPPPPRGGAPAAYLAKLGGKQKAIVKQLYKKNSATIPNDFPKKLTQVPALFPKTKKALADVVALVIASPAIRVRLDVIVNVSGPGMTDLLARDRANKQAQLIAEYFARQQAPMDRVAVNVVARGKSSGKKGGQATTKLELRVLTYPQ